MTSEATTEQWSVVLTNLKQEKVAKFHLDRQKFDSYLPLYMPEHPKAKIHPLFVGMMFVRIDIGNEFWRPVLSTIGVRNVIRNGAGRPVTIHDWVIKEIKDRERDGLVQLDPKITSQFKVGEQVGIKQSPLRAVFQERVDARRSAILVSLCGVESRIVVSTQKLEAIAS